jgi:hypothetical protein
MSFFSTTGCHVFPLVSSKKEKEKEGVKSLQAVAETKIPLSGH